MDMIERQREHGCKQLGIPEKIFMLRAYLSVGIGVRGYFHYNNAVSLT